ALVPFLLAAGEADEHLGMRAEEVDLQRHDREALLARLARELLDLLLVQQQLALAAGGVVGPGALHVRGDVGVVHPHLAGVHVAVAVDERGPRSRSDFTSVPDRTMPASQVWSMK